MCFLQTKYTIRTLNIDFKLNSFLFGSVKLTKNAGLDKYKHSGFDKGFDSRSKFLFPNGIFGKNVISFGADMRSKF